MLISPNIRKKESVFRGLLLVLLFHIWLPVSHAENSSSCQKILLLNSYHSTFQWTADVTRGVREVLSDPEKYRVFVEYMDAKRFQNPAYTEKLADLYQKKYGETNIDGLIISDNKAFDFYLQYGGEIWGDSIPVAFCGINNIGEYDDLDTLRFRGVEEAINIDSTLQVIKTLQPDLESLVVVSDPTLSGNIFTQQFVQTIESGHPDLDYQMISTSQPRVLADSLRAICPHNKAIYLLSMYIKRDGITREMVREARLIKENCPVPVYGNWDFLFDDFIMGGVIIRGYEQGCEAGKAMKSLLEGDNSRPWLVSAQETLAFDHQQLKTSRHFINQAGLIDQALILNKPESVFRKYRREIIMVSLIGVALLLVIFVMLRVINELRKTKKWLLKSESRLELALEGADEGLWDADFTTGEIFLSHRFATLLEYDNANELSLNFENYRDLFHPSDRHQVSEAYRMHESGKAPVFRCEARMLTKTEQYKWFSVHGKIIERYAMGEPLRMTGTLTNIQQQKEFENKLKEAKEKAEESDLLKSAFLANMSHEIRTPMNAILGFTDLLIHEVSDQEEQETYLKMIKSSGENLLNLINDIIDISKIESGQLQINHQHFDLHQLLKETAGIAENLLGQTGRAIQFKTSYYVNNQEFFIKTDPFRLRQILFNLITNAIKFTDEGYIETGYIIRNSHELEFFVKDTGIGISHHHQQIIFERFRQAHDNSLKQYGGTGLGLAITQSLVAMMDGDIWVRSVPGEGAEFRFRLPCNPSQN